MLLTLSRSSYVGLMAGLVFLGIVKQPFILVGLTFAPLVAISLVPPDVLDRLLSIYYALSSIEMTPAWEARLEAWWMYIPTIIKHPFIGKGLYFIPPGEVDNEFILRGVETGILGLMSFVWVFWSFVRRSWFSLKQAVEPIDAQLNLGYLAGMSGMVVHALAATSFTAIRTAEPVYFLSGLVVANYLMILDIQPADTTVDIKRSEQERMIEAERQHRKERRSPPVPGDV